MVKYKKLKNPPVKECVIGIGIRNYFENDLKTKSIYREVEFLYPKVLETIKKDIKIKGTIIDTQVVPNGYRFSDSSNKEYVFIEKNRVAFSDINKYENFDVFFDKFSKVLNIIEKHLPIENNVKALVNSSLQFIGENPKLQVIFNIDTIADVAKEKISSNNFDKIKECVLKLKDFKNEIFFANVDENIKEFDK